MRDTAQRRLGPPPGVGMRRWAASRARGKSAARCEKPGPADSAWLPAGLACPGGFAGSGELWTAVAAAAAQVAAGEKTKAAEEEIDQSRVAPAAAAGLTGARVAVGGAASGVGYPQASVGANYSTGRPYLITGAEHVDGARSQDSRLASAPSRTHFPKEQGSERPARIDAQVRLQPALRDGAWQGVEWVGGCWGCGGTRRERVQHD